MRGDVTGERGEEKEETEGLEERHGVAGVTKLRRKKRQVFESG